jgi:hypothetical protein
MRRVTVSEIELADKIKKGQFKTGKFSNRKIDYVGTLERCTCRLTIADTHLQQS